MSSSLSMKLNTQEIMELNSNVKGLKNDIDSYLAAIHRNLSTLDYEIKSYEISNLIKKINMSIDQIDSKLSTNIENLITFLEQQMKGYETTTIEATKMLREALDFIYVNFSGGTTSEPM